MFGSNPGPIIIDNHQLEVVESYKLLGVFIDKQLNWSVHAKHLISKCKTILYFLNKLKYRLDEHNKLLIYKSLIQSLLHFSTPIWQSMSQIHSSRLQVIMNNAMRAIFRLKRRDNTEKVMKEKGIMNLTQLCAYNSMILVKKAKHDIHCNPRIRMMFQDKEENKGMMIDGSFYKRHG